MTRLGTVLSLADVPLAESAATAFDIVWLDLEHGALTVSDAQTLAIVVQGVGCEAHVRLPRWDSELAPALLDAAVDGLVAPRVDSALEAEAFARRLRYPPVGDRGYGPRRAGSYGRGDERPRPRCTVQIETVEGLEAVKPIAAVEGIDALVVGCSDLSLALGVDEPARLRPAIDRVAAAAEAAGIPMGIAGSGDPATLAGALSRPPDLLVYSVDVRLYARAVDGAAQALASALQKAHAPA